MTSNLRRKLNFSQSTPPRQKISIFFFKNNYPKALILSKNWDGFLKSRPLKNEITSEKKIKFFAKYPTPKKFFEIFFQNN